MMQNARLIPDVVNEIEMPSGATFALLAGNGIDMLYFAQHRDGDDALVINDQIGGNWGVESRLPFSDGRRPILSFKYQNQSIEAWTDAAAQDFPRFDQERFKSVAFVRCRNARIITNYMVFQLESLDQTLGSIDSHIFHRRLDDLERRLKDSERLEKDKD